MTQPLTPTDGPADVPAPRPGTAVVPDGRSLADVLTDLDAMLARVSTMHAAVVRSLPNTDDGSVPESLTSMKLDYASGYLRDAREELDSALRSWLAETREPARLRACGYCGRLPGRSGGAR